jgi:cobalamin biosynthesis protein CbiD
VEISLPGGEKGELPVARLKLKKNRASAAVQKNAGDDPDSVGIVKSVLRHLFADT